MSEIRPRVYGGDLVYPKRGAPPQEMDGYKRDPKDNYRLNSLWPDCNYRSVEIIIKSCGSAIRRKICKCENCPTYNKTLMLSNCINCEFRLDQHQ